MLNLYRKSQAAQFNWMRNHPFQYIALNGALIVVGIAFIELWDRRQNREFNENEITQQDPK